MCTEDGSLQCFFLKDYDISVKSLSTNEPVDFISRVHINNIEVWRQLDSYLYTYKGFRGKKLFSHVNEFPYQTFFNFKTVTHSEYREAH